AAPAHRRRRQELVGLVQHWAAVAGGADTGLLRRRCEGHVLEEEAPALLGGGAAPGQRRRMAGPREREQVPRAEEAARPFEHRDQLLFLGGRRARAACVV